MPGILLAPAQMAEQAQTQDAQLVLFPEFMSQGYLLTSALWNSASPLTVPLSAGSCETSRQLRMYLGTSFLEVRLDEHHALGRHGSP